MWKVFVFASLSGVGSLRVEVCEEGVVLGLEYGSPTEAIVLIWVLKTGAARVALKRREVVRRADMVECVELTIVIMVN